MPIYMSSRWGFEEGRYVGRSLAGTSANVAATLVAFEGEEEPGVLEPDQMEVACTRAKKITRSIPRRSKQLRT